MPNKNFVALYSPFPGMGKTEIANTLARLGYLRVKFAEPLKAMLGVFLHEAGVSIDDIDRMIEGDLKELPIPSLKGITPRKLMQTLGTEWGRHCVYTDVWVDMAIRKAQGLLDCGYKVVIDDLRFPNEYDALQSAGATKVKVVRNCTMLADYVHVSDNALGGRDFDYILSNDKDLTSLRVKAIELFR